MPTRDAIFVFTEKTAGFASWAGIIGRTTGVIIGNYELRKFPATSASAVVT